jgi:transposase-like protein
MSQRRDFVEDAARGHDPMRELCARYGISPRVGYKWLVEARQRHPTWGPRKPLAYNASAADAARSST